METNIGNKYGKNEFRVAFDEGIFNCDKFMQQETPRGVIITTSDKCDTWGKILRC